MRRRSCEDGLLIMLLLPLDVERGFLTPPGRTVLPAE
jgi:hypothetical protein